MFDVELARSSVCMSDSNEYARDSQIFLINPKIASSSHFKSWSVPE